MGLDWIGLDGWLSYTAVTPRASLKSDANNLDQTLAQAAQREGKKREIKQKNPSFIF